MSAPDEKGVDPDARQEQAGRVAALSTRARASSEAVEARVRESRATHGSVDAAFEAFERERAFAGPLLGAGLAYRMFLWLLPLALVVSQIVGYWYDVDPEAVDDTTRRFGLSGLATQVVGDAAATSSNNRLLLLLLGILLSLYFTYTLLRSLRLASATAWGIPYVRARRVGPAVLVLLVLIVGVWGATLLAAAARRSSPGVGLLATLAIFGLYAGAALLG